MKKKLYFLAFLFSFFLNAQNNNNCWTLIHNGVDIYNGQQGNESNGHHDPQTTDLTQVKNGFLTSGYYNKQSFDSNDGLVYNKLKDKAGSYLTKHDYDGNLKWIVYTEKYQYSERDIIHGSAEDKQGNIFLIGHSYNGIFYDSKGTKINFKNSNLSSYGFIVKLNGNGEILWYSQLNNVYPKRITMDNDDNILLSGTLSVYNNRKMVYALNGTITEKFSYFENFGDEKNYINSFVLKINSVGKVLWHTGIKIDGPNNEFLEDIGSDNNNNVYITGYCGSNAEIYSAGTTKKPNIIKWKSIYAKTFLVKFDKNGQFLWNVKSLLDHPTDNGVQAYSLTVDEQGNSYISGSNEAGYVSSPNQIFENTDGSITSEKVGSLFIAKVNTNGVCEWIRGASTSYYGIGYKVIKSNDEIITVAKVWDNVSLSQEVEFLSTNKKNITASFYPGDYFIVVYDTKGNLKRVVSNGINNKRFFFQDRISGFFKDDNDNYYISRNLGFFINVFDDYNNFGHTFNINDTDRADGIVTKFNESCGLIVGNTINENIPNLSLCDNTSVGTNTDGHILFNLTLREKDILINETLSNYDISYFTNKELTNLISAPKKYKNSTKTETIYVKATHKYNSNKSGTTSFIINVMDLPNSINSITLKQCDNEDINGFTSFNLNEIKTKIISNSENYTITFFKEKNLAENNIDPILNPSTYTNQVISNDKVWARVENNNGCFNISEVNLIISTTQIPNSFSKIFYQCDNGTDTKDGIASFDFSSVTQEVINLFPSNQDLIIKYYKNENDALSESNEITNISNHQNTESPNSQNIYIRVDNKLNNDCLALGHHITLNVEKTPIANSVTINPECDNDKDGIFDFDTSTIHKTIIGNQTNVTVKYFDKDNNPLPSPLPNPFSTSTQTVTARILNTVSKVPNGQCYDETLINFVVNTTPTLSRVPAQKKCDRDFDGIESFDTSAIENTLLGNQTGMVVKYFDENNNPLPSPLPNPFTSSTQTIRVRVENPKYSLCFNETTIDFIVNEKPYFELDTQTIICTNINSSIDMTVLNPKGNYYYTWKDENGNIISNDIKAKASKGGNYFVTAISNFGCESDTKSIQVIESSISSITVNDLEITDDSENNSIKINTSNIGSGNYEFSLLDSNSNTIYDFQKVPFFDNLRGGIYTILIKDINKCGVQSFVISIISYPKFFTPNQDGVNDTWHILGIGKSFYKNGNVKIYNRFGKLLKTLSIDSSGWDGTSDGVKLPSNDYWFYAELTDPKGIVITKKGSFSLIRK